MKSPITGEEMVLFKEKRNLTFRKQTFEVYFHYFKCETSGETFTTTELDDLSLNQLYNQYRVKHNLPFPEEITSIRKKYQLSAAKMSEVLGFGTNSYRNYENGEVPLESNARLIQLVNDPHEFRKLVEYSNTFSSKALKEMMNRIDYLLSETKLNNTSHRIEQLFNLSPSIKTGYRTTNIDKLSEMVAYFTEQMQPYKTKLNKLLFYADFEMYRKTGYSISGAQYVAIDMGPVPNLFQTMYEYIANKGIININNIEFDANITGEKFVKVPNRSFHAAIFEPLELSVMFEIAQKFNAMSTKDIIEYSHKEKAWIENVKKKDIIDYTYSFDLN